MHLQNLLSLAFITGVLSACKEPRQVIVTVTADAASPSPKPLSAPSPVPLSAPPVPWEQSSAAGATASIPTAVPVPASGALSLPPQASSLPKTASPTPASGGPSSGAKCGKGFTYCGYMLTGVGHNFSPSDIDKSYCAGLPELCAGGGNKRKTKPDQAVFVCMEDQPSTVQLMCACSGTCLNNATTNYIAHCDKPCVNA
ncbi:hypothetical protein F5B22DRAFT_645787 [Xylaria bambusicola]|uniref:uncharacterized protein n=1 Tax=Xylaria bambusicola TaxID=326684 RepID=UPI002008101F|nr:uncharacterized protein F5B22DRAFT_645787 [Xylaria bambusicola]KAI0517608.1 hypothetical protein F5B22DRAFT_645787 [Xylaria bambusicola]